MAKILPRLQRPKCQTGPNAGKPGPCPGNKPDEAADRFDRAGDPTAVPLSVGAIRDQVVSDSSKERMVVTDKDGVVLGTAEGEAESVGMPDVPGLTDSGTGLVAHHNHPYDSPPSIGDLLELARHDGVGTIYAHSPDASYRVELLTDDRDGFYRAVKDAYGDAKMDLMDEYDDPPADQEGRTRYRREFHFKIAETALQRLSEEGWIGYIREPMRKQKTLPKLKFHATTKKQDVAGKPCPPGYNAARDNCVPRKPGGKKPGGEKPAGKKPTPEEKQPVLDALKKITDGEPLTKDEAKAILGGLDKLTKAEYKKFLRSINVPLGKRMKDALKAYILEQIKDKLAAAGGGESEEKPEEKPEPEEKPKKGKYKPVKFDKYAEQYTDDMVREALDGIFDQAIGADSATKMKAADNIEEFTNRLVDSQGALLTRWQLQNYLGQEVDFVGEARGVMYGLLDADKKPESKKVEIDYVPTGNYLSTDYSKGPPGPPVKFDPQADTLGVVDDYYPDIPDLTLDQLADAKILIQVLGAKAVKPSFFTDKFGTAWTEAALAAGILTPADGGYNMDTDEFVRMLVARLPVPKTTDDKKRIRRTADILFADGAADKWRSAIAEKFGVDPGDLYMPYQYYQAATTAAIAAGLEPSIKNWLANSPKRQAVEAFAKEYGERVGRLEEEKEWRRKRAAEISSAIADLHQKADMYGASGPSTKEGKAAVMRMNHARARLRAERKKYFDPWSAKGPDVGSELDKAKAEAKANLAQAFGTTNGTTPPCDARDAVLSQIKNPSHRSRAEAVYDKSMAFFKSMLADSPGLQKMKKVTVKQTDKRAFYDPDDHSVNTFASYDNKDSGIFIHELGHAIEHELGLLDVMGQFLNYRCAGEQDSQIYKDSNEYGRKDRFDEAFGTSGHYVGKTYPFATEVLSMGLQKMYEDPATFAAKDPEYFTFVLSVLDGTVKEYVDSLKK